MDKQKTTRTLVVTNREGLHLRVASIIVALASRFDCSIEIIKDSRRIDCKKEPLQLTSFGVEQGDSVLFEALGCDSEVAIDALEALFRSNFEETEQPNN